MLVDTVNFDNSDVDDFNFWGDTDSSDSDFFGNGFDTDSDSGWDDTDSGRLLVITLRTAWLKISCCVFGDILISRTDLDGT